MLYVNKKNNIYCIYNKTINVIDKITKYDMLKFLHFM